MFREGDALHAVKVAAGTRTRAARNPPVACGNERRGFGHRREFMARYFLALTSFARGSETDLGAGGGSITRPSGEKASS
jgi:hypothetical protein